MGTTQIKNFGENVVFTPKHFYCPDNIAELLDILELHPKAKIRAIGSLHAWSPVAQSGEITISLEKFNAVKVEHDEEGAIATIGGGCQIKRVISELAKLDLAMPALGLISEQTIAGATSTATHGSGRHCLSHYLTAVHIAHYDPLTSAPTISVIRDPDILRAAKCALGCMGIIVAVEIRPRPAFRIEEYLGFYPKLADVLEQESAYPLQQFYYLPWLDRYLGQHRRESDRPRSWLAPLYRWYWFLIIDLGLHLILKGIMQVLRSRKFAKLFFRFLAPWTIIRKWRVVDHSQDMLIMEHELFRHLEIELLVKRSELAEAMEISRQLISWADSSVPFPPQTQRLIEQNQLQSSSEKAAGGYTHHYPICVRRVLPDNLLVSMTGGGTEDYYAISFITYDLPNQRDGFFRFAELLSMVMFHRFNARCHWGKYTPYHHAQIAANYPQLELFIQRCRQFDPEGRFQNAWVRKVVFSGEVIQ
jgi:hypothetical protein